MTKIVKKRLLFVIFAFFASVVLCLFTLNLQPVKAEGTYISGYGFTSNNDSGKISGVPEGVRLFAKEATEGNIYDYTYNKALNPKDLNVVFNVWHDTTRGVGTHSRLNFYFLPSADAPLEDGVKVQLILTGYDDDRVKCQMGEGFICPDGYKEEALMFYMSSDFTINMRLFNEGANWYINVNSARWQFDGNNDNINKLNGFQETTYMRTTAHFQENGESALGMDVIIHSIDEVSFGSAIEVKNTETSPQSIIGYTHQDQDANTTYNLTDNGLALSGQFQKEVEQIFTYGGESFEIVAGKLGSYSMTMDVSGVNNVTKDTDMRNEIGVEERGTQKYIEISFTNVLKNGDRFTAWHWKDDYNVEGHEGFTAVTYRLYLDASIPSELIVMHQSTYNTFIGCDNLLVVPEYEFKSFIPREDGKFSFNIIKYRDSWKVLVNGACLGFSGSANDALTFLNSGTVGVSVGIGSNKAANYYASSGEVPTDTLVITGLDGYKIKPNLLDFKMTTGAYLRVKSMEGSGLTFETELDKAAVDELLAKVGTEYKSVTFGTVIFPKDYLTKAGAPTLEALEYAEYNNILNIVSADFNEDRSNDEVYRYKATMTHIKPNNYCRDFIGRGYVMVEDMLGYRQVTYAAYDETNARNVYSVAKAMYTDRSDVQEGKYQNAVTETSFSPFEGRALNIAKSYIDGVVVLSVDGNNATYAGGIEENVYAVPYSATSTDGVTFTVVSTSDIKFLVVNGKFTRFTPGSDSKSCTFTWTKEM